MTSATVLVVEDDADISTVIQAALQRSGYAVVNVPDGRGAIRGLFETRPDLVILDIGLPDVDGFDVLERFRDASDVPILMLTARGREADKVRALDAGADDYLTKPFGTAELASRVQALLRRARPRTAEIAFLDDGFVAFDFANRAVTVLGRPVQLTPTEYRLLRTFALSPDQVLSTETLLEEAWRDPSATAPTRVKHAIRRLRAKLAEAGAPADTIEVVRGFGYRYRAPKGAGPTA
jgi:DNA-binding response OmpR family regulator